MPLTMGMLGSGTAPRVATFTHNASIPNVNTTFSYAGVALGSASPNRRIVTAFSVRNNNALVPTSIVIAGIAATIITTIQNGNSNCIIAIAAVPTGTTGQIDIIFPGNCQACAISVFALTGALSDTPFDTKTSIVAAPTASVNSGLGGCIIAGLFNGAGGTTSWVGVTEDVDTTFSSTFVYSAGHVNALSAGATTVTATLTNSSTPAMCAVSF